MEFEKLLESDTFCVAPWIETHIGVDGKIMPCCGYDAGNPFGNIKESTIEQAFNSPQAIKARQDMINGVKHKGCYKCWRDEDLHGHSYRTAHRDQYGRISELSFNRMTEDFKILPLHLKRLDLRFDNKCNLKCRICSPKYSTAWTSEGKDLKENYDWEGMELHLHETDGGYDISIDDSNFEVLLKNLHSVEHLFFAGGEPLIQDKHYELLQYCIDNDLAKNIQIVYNTNFTKLTYKGKNVLDFWKHFEYVACSTSLDDFGKRGEFQRTNLKWEEVVENRKKIAELENIHFQISPTISVYNVFSIVDFIEDWINLGFLQPDKSSDIYMNILYFPHLLNICNLPDNLKNDVRKKYSDWMKRYEGREPYQSVFKHLNKVLQALDQDRTRSVEVWEEQFVNYNTTLDNFRNEDFRDVLPEYANLTATKDPQNKSSV